MTMTRDNSSQVQRKAAMAVLADSAASEIACHLNAIALPVHENLREAENGLVMVRGRIGGDGAPFNLGEATVSRAAVRLATGEITDPEPRKKNGVADRSMTRLTPSLRFTASMPDIQRRAASLFFSASFLSSPLRSSSSGSFGFSR